MSVFKHHKQITTDEMERRVLPGLSGAFRNRLEEERVEVDKPVVGVAVQLNTRGEVEGCRALKAGVVSPKEINTKEIWPEAEEGKLVIPPFEVGEFRDTNGLLSTPWKDLKWKIMVKQGNNMRAVKRKELVDRGYSDLSFRLNISTVSNSKMEMMVVAVPCSVDDLASLGEEVHSRGFPVIKIWKGAARLVTEEEPEQRFGLGVQPFYIVSDAGLGVDGEVDVAEVTWPASAEVKKVVALLLRSAVVPNWYLKRSTREEAIRGKKFSKKAPTWMWPEPLEEDERDTEGSEESDVEGQ